MTILIQAVCAAHGQPAASYVGRQHAGAISLCTMIIMGLTPFQAPFKPRSS